jgi:hypothetical protein
MMQPMNADRGILVIAQGKQRYIDMAKNIAMSVKLSNPDLQLALVTDSDDKELDTYYLHIIPIRPEFGIGFSQKLHIYDYSPFQRTMFIDVDCLVIRNIDFLWKLFYGKDMSVIGKKKYSGEYIGTSIESLKKQFVFDYLPSFNGGVYYFEKNEAARAIFQFAIEIFKNKYDELGLWKFDGRPGDEPVMAIAMGVNKVEPVDDQKQGMYTPVGQSGVFKMDALAGVCEFYKGGEKVYPSIMHFGGGYPEAFHYRREILKIKLVYNFRLPAKIVSIGVNMLYNTCYIVFVFCYRLIKSVVKRQKFKLTPLMPMFRFE